MIAVIAKNGMVWRTNFLSAAGWTGSSSLLRLVCVGPATLWMKATNRQFVWSEAEGEKADGRSAILHLQLSMTVSTGNAENG